MFTRRTNIALIATTMMVVTAVYTANFVLMGAEPTPEARVAAILQRHVQDTLPHGEAAFRWECVGTGYVINCAVIGSSQFSFALQAIERLPPCTVSWQRTLTGSSVVSITSPGHSAMASGSVDMLERALTTVRRGATVFTRQ